MTFGIKPETGMILLGCFGLAVAACGANASGDKESNSDKWCEQEAAELDGAQLVAGSPEADAYLRRYEQYLHICIGPEEED